MIVWITVYVLRFILDSGSVSHAFPQHTSIKFMIIYLAVDHEGMWRTWEGCHPCSTLECLWKLWVEIQKTVHGLASAYMEALALVRWLWQEGDGSRLECGCHHLEQIIRYVQWNYYWPSIFGAGRRRMWIPFYTSVKFITVLCISIRTRTRMDGLASASARCVYVWREKVGAQDQNWMNIGPQHLANSQ